MRGLFRLRLGYRRLFSVTPKSHEGVHVGSVSSASREAVDLGSLSEDQLRSELQEAGLPLSGSRDEMVRRLLKFSEAQGARAQQQLPESAWEYEYARNPDIDLLDLREELETLGMPTHGSRQDMIRRLALHHEENDIVNEGWFEFFDRLSDAKLDAEIKRRGLDGSGGRDERLAVLVESVQREERATVAALLERNYATQELRVMLHDRDLSPDGAKEVLSARLAEALDDLEREQVKDSAGETEDAARREARVEAVQRRQMQRYLDQNLDPAVNFRQSETVLRLGLLDEGDDFSLPRVERVSEQPRNPANRRYEPHAPALQLSAEEEASILRDGFPDYGTALASFFKHCVGRDALGQRWIDTSLSLGGDFMKAKHLKGGRHHWCDEQYTYGIICIKMGERNLGQPRTIDRYARNPEVIQRNVVMLDLKGRTLYCLEVKAADGEPEPEFGHDWAAYKLSSNWVTAFKKVKWPDNYNDASLHWFLPINTGPLEDSILNSYPLEFGPAQGLVFSRD